MARKKLLRLTSPKGVARYPWLSRPDVQFNTDGVYKVNLLVPVSECAELCAKLDELAEESYREAVAKAKTPAIAKQIKKAAPYGMFLDPETGEETGQIEFKFKMNAKIKTATGEFKTLKPFIFDAKGNQVVVVPNIYGGSVLKVNFSPSPYFAANNKTAGISLRMNAVQVIELVSGTGGGATGYGFGEEEGFVASEDQTDISNADTGGAEEENIDF
jgi:hypothetical protein